MQAGIDGVAGAITLILRPDESVAGTGFLVAGTGLIATCAHVVQDAAEQQQGDPPPGSAKVVFQATGTDRASRVTADADVIPEWWRPADAEDVAILRLDAVPDGVRPAQLGSSGGANAHSVRTFGFPDTGPIEGLPGQGEITGETHHVGRRILVGRSPEITQGFSGAPVWDDARRRVIGMVTLITEPDDAQRLQETFFATTAETLKEICPELEVTDVQPYRDLEPFEEEHEEFFRGRQALVNELLARLGSNPRFLALLGPPGSGKSSVVRAGLVPALKGGKVPDSDRWSIAVFRPLADPLAELGRTALGPVATLDAAVDKAIGGGATRLLLVVDQAEELFTHTPENKAKAFLTELTGVLAERPTSVVMTMRSDFYGRLGEYAPPMLRWLEGGLLNTDGSRLDERQLKAIVEEPASAVGLEFSPGLVEALVDDALLDSPGERGQRTKSSAVLPLLEFALTRLWERRQDGQLTHDAYDLTPGVTGALAQWADDTYAGFTEQEEPIAERIFVDLVHFGDPRLGIPDTRRRRLAGELAPGHADRAAVERVLERLVDRRLLTTSGGVGEEPLTVEVIHDAVLKGWARLTGWITRERLYRIWLQGVQDQLDDWSTNQAAGRQKEAEAVALRGPQLEEAERWSVEHAVDMSPAQLAFIDASRVVKRKERRRALERRLAVAALFVLVGGLGGVAAFRTMQEQAARTSASALMTFISAGAADLGDPPKSVSLPAFSMDQHEVSVEQYQLCVEQGRCSAPDRVPGVAPGPRLPAVGVKATQAADFCRWLGRRLPTFREWERAVRGSTYRPWPWGDAPPGPERVNALFAAGDRDLATVDDPNFSAGATRDGLRDLLGNAREWTTTPTDCDPYGCPAEWTPTSTQPVALMVVGLSAKEQFVAHTAFEPFPAEPSHSDAITGFRCASS
jgi:formylglycine-generating enzyme required for sulfatase activity